MKQIILALLAAGAVTASAGVVVSKAPVPVAMKPVDPCAGPISYNNAELLYAYTDFDLVGDGLIDNDGHGNGGILRVEYSSWDNFYIVGGVEYHDVLDTDLWSLSGGVGGYIALSENVHLVAEIGGLWTSFEADVFVSDGSSEGTGVFVRDDVEEWGWYVRPHLRAKWGCFEMHIGADYADRGTNGNNEDWGGFVNLYYQVSPGWDLTAGARFTSDETMWTGGARYRY